MVAKRLDKLKRKLPPKKSKPPIVKKRAAPVKKSAPAPLLVAQVAVEPPPTLKKSRLVFSPEGVFLRIEEE